MKIAIVGSRNISNISLEDYISKEALTKTEEIVTGGAKGIDSLAKNFANKNYKKLTVFLPEYSKYRWVAPLKRNELISLHADEAYIFWDGKSKGTKHIINCFEKQSKKINLFII